MVDIAHFNAAEVSTGDAAVRHRASGAAPAPLTSIACEEWSGLAQRALEPNAYNLPDWELAVNATAPGRTDVGTLAAWTEASDTGGAGRLIGLLPVISLWRAYRLPLPALASADPYGTLCTPLLDRTSAHDAVLRLMNEARRTGARTLVLRDMSLAGAAMQAITKALAEDGLQPRILTSRVRALLDCTRDADTLLRDALGPKKLKELRRQRHRLAEHGEIRFEVARSPQEVAAAIELFLTLEAGGWKGKRGTALQQTAGDAAFIRRAAVALAERGQCEIAILRAGNTTIAAAVVPRHLDRAWFFKIGIDETFARMSPGVQLTLELTRHLCADPAIASADSTASSDHPMIDHIWRGRLPIGDVLIPLRRNDPAVWLIHAALGLRSVVRDVLRCMLRR